MLLPKTNSVTARSALIAGRDMIYQDVLKFTETWLGILRITFAVLSNGEYMPMRVNIILLSSTSAARNPSDLGSPVAKLKPNFSHIPFLLHVISHVLHLLLCCLETPRGTTCSRHRVSAYQYHCIGTKGRLGRRNKSAEPEMMFFFLAFLVNSSIHYRICEGSIR
jgi:hypothetical protein